MAQVKLTFSEIIFLFADRYISDRAKFINTYSHPSGGKLPVKPLSVTLVLAALAYLVEEGYVTLSVKEVKKLFIFSGREVMITPLKKNGVQLNSLEEIIYTNSGVGASLRKAVYNILSSDESIPWGQITNIVRDAVYDKGFLDVTEKKFLTVIKSYAIKKNRVSEYEDEFEKAKTALQKFQSNPIYDEVIKAIEKGIADRQEHISSDD